MTAVLTPEASTWAMLMLGFGGLGFAAFFVGMNIRTGLCSYCSAPLPESNMPLVMWNADPLLHQMPARLVDVVSKSESLALAELRELVSDLARRVALLEADHVKRHAAAIKAHKEPSRAAVWSIIRNQQDVSRK
jgi:hypothetical protein